MFPVKRPLIIFLALFFVLTPFMFGGIFSFSNHTLAEDAYTVSADETWPKNKNETSVTVDGVVTVDRGVTLMIYDGVTIHLFPKPIRPLRE